MLEEAKKLECKIYPIALEKNMRIPSAVVQEYQSFDTSVCLENRILRHNSMETVAQICARKIISLSHPTFYTEDKLLFVSHKRVDGEEIAAKLCDKINELEKNKRTFRDVVDVQVGEEAQNKIDEKLEESDVLIFLHTPKAVESIWIKKEIQTAILLDIPILWIRIDDASIEDLEIIPGDKPHLEYKSEIFNESEELENIVNTIEEMCFDMIMGRTEGIYDHLYAFKQWGSELGVQIKCLDQSEQIYKIIYEEQLEMGYPRRDYIQYVQYYSRTIKKDDIERFKKYMRQETYNNGDLKYDSGVIIGRRTASESLSNNLFKKDIENHFILWRNLVGEKLKMNGKKIVISGAFPDVEEIYKRPMMEAVKIFSEEVIKNGYRLVFGAHPTFQRIMFTVAKAFDKEPKEVLFMYVSQFFKQKDNGQGYDIEKLKKYAQVYEIEEFGGRDTSLTRMREEMLRSEDIAAVICIGGKIKKDSPEAQGVDEEISIARRLDIPVFLVGSVGGRSSEKAMELKENNAWQEINECSNKLNEELIYSLDYRKLAIQIIQEIEKEKI